jgi:hypothetical protein
MFGCLLYLLAHLQTFVHQILNYLPAVGRPLYGSPFNASQLPKTNQLQASLSLSGGVMRPWTFLLPRRPAFSSNAGIGMSYVTPGLSYRTAYLSNHWDLLSFWGLAIATQVCRAQEPRPA